MLHESTSPHGVSGKSKARYIFAHVIFSFFALLSSVVCTLYIRIRFNHLIVGKKKFRKLLLLPLIRIFNLTVTELDGIILNLFSSFFLLQTVEI